MVNRTRSIPMKFRAVNFGITCLAMRLELKLSGEQAAEMLPFDKSALFKYERGEEDNMKMQNFLALCNLYDLNPADFFELEY